MNPSLNTQETTPSNMIRSASHDLAVNLSSIFVHENHPAFMSCNLEVGVNGEEIFRLQMKPLLARCGLLVKLVKQAYSIRPRDTDASKSVLTVKLENFPGGAEAFDLAAKFCVCESDVPITFSNVAMLRCVAEFLEMTEEYGKGNLCRRTEYFLKHEVFWNWNDTLVVLKSCEPFLIIAEKSEIIPRCAKALAFRACSSPDSLGFSDPPSFSSDSLDLNFSSGSNSSRSSVKSPISGNWWFQDLSSLSVYLMERVVRALFKNGIDHKNLAKFLLHYLRSSLPPAQFGSHVFGGSNLPSPSTSGRRIEDDKSARRIEDEKAQKSSVKLQVEILETVVELLSDLEPRSASCRSLFGLLRTAVTISACKSTRREIEKMIGVQLEKANLDNILIPAPPRRNSALYDVDLIVRLAEHFLKDQAEALSALPCNPRTERKCDSDFAFKTGGNSPVRAALLRVGELIDKYLAEVAADSHLKPAKFRALAEILPDTARNCSDGLFRAVEIFFEAHPNLPVSEATALCRLMNLQRLSLDACKRVTQNPKFPASFVLQAVLVQQGQTRSANTDTCLPRDYHDMKCKPSSKDAYSYNREGRLSRQSMVVHLECSNFEFMVRQNQDLKRNLKKMHTRVAELETTYKRLRLEMGRLFRTKRRSKQQDSPQPQPQCAA
ncbi:unnamed protein product [Calypogeia fissa]